jgi:hypothetical protein
VARIHPVFKNGDKKDKRNYRPVSIISSIPKLFETLIYNNLYGQVAPFLLGSQHGFLPKKSTTTNLLTVSLYIAEYLDERKQVDVIYTDMAKAFDRVDHDILLNRLHSVGCDHNTLYFFASYLYSRKQYVEINKQSSNEIFVNSGVPKGSNLGPLLFLILIDGIQSAMKYGSIEIYTDDIKLYNKVEVTRGL